MARKEYYTLVERDADGIWYDGFGSYKRTEVREEQLSRRDDGVKAKDLTIVMTDGSAAHLISALAKLNAMVQA
jgi:hypothetical protein